MRKLVSVPAGVVLLFLLCSCSMPHGGPQSSPEKVVDSYLAAFQKSDFETMFLYTAEPEKSEEELAQLKYFIQMIELIDYNILQVEYLSASEAEVEIKLIMRLMGHEKRHSDRVRVISKEGKWYLAKDFGCEKQQL